MFATTLCPKLIFQISVAILRLLEQEKVVTEGGGAAGYAAIISNAIPELKGKT